MHKSIAAFLGIWMLMLGSGCQPRNPAAGGLMTAEPVAAEAIGQGGFYEIRCTVNSASHQGFLLNIKGAVSPDDEAQLLKISVARLTSDGKAGEVMHADESGRGVVGATNLFIGFRGGVLTGEAVKGASQTYQGMLTLAQDIQINGANVTCKVTPGAQTGAPK